MFFRHRFLHRFLIALFPDFSPKWLPKWSGVTLMRPPPEASKINLFPQGSFWEVPWSLRLPFWCILVAFGYHFGIILVILDHFGTHFGPFCTFSVPIFLQKRVVWDLGRDWAPFWDPLRDLGSIFYRNHIFDTLFRGTSAEYRWHLRRESFSFALGPLPPWPGAETCRRQPW